MNTDESDRRDAEVRRTAVRGALLYTALDLWLAIGFAGGEFHQYVEAVGVTDTWSRLLDLVRRGSVCATPTEADDWCVLREGHIGPHCGSRDGGPPNDLLDKWWKLRNLDRP